MVGLTWLRGALVIVGGYVAISILLLGSSAFADELDAPEIQMTAPVSGTVFPPCTGEPVQVTGFFHASMSVGDNHLHSLELTHVQGLGLISGRRYTGTMQDTAMANGDDPPFTSTHEFHVLFTRSGELATVATAGDDFYDRVFSKVTFNANGDMTASQFDISAPVCR